MIRFAGKIKYHIRIIVLDSLCVRLIVLKKTGSGGFITAKR